MRARCDLRVSTLLLGFRPGPAGHMKGRRTLDMRPSLCLAYMRYEYSVLSSGREQGRGGEREPEDVSLVL